MANPTKVWLTVPEYAAHAQLSGRYVRDLIARGQITKRSTRPFGTRKQIHRERADEDMELNVHTQHPGAAPRNIPKAARKEPSPDDAPGKTAQAVNAAGTGKLSFSDAKTIQAQYRAALLKLEYGEKSGELVKRKDVESEFFMIARTVRDAVLNVPGRVSAELAGVTDQHVINSRIEEELVKALEELARNEDN